MKLTNKIYKGGQNIYKMGMYISSYIPIFLMIFINSMDEISLEGVFDAFHKNKWFWLFIFIIMGLCLFVICDFLKQLDRSASNNTKPINIELANLEVNESEIINYFITYLIPILTLDPSKWPSILSNIILIILVGIYFVRNNLLSFNILFLLMNYRIYKDQYTNIYISKVNYNKAISNNLEAYQYNNSNIYWLVKKQHASDKNSNARKHI